MRRTNWFERKFATIDDNGLLPGILERLDGTTPRLRALIAGRKPAVTPDAWSAAKELGHLVDLEPLWRQRISEIAAGHADMTAADLTNRKTHDADHDHWTLDELVDRFEPLRDDLVSALRRMSDSDLERSARHPRLGTPMRVIDLAYFVAEHDDHHIAKLRLLLS